MPNGGVPNLPTTPLPKSSGNNSPSHSISTSPATSAPPLPPNPSSGPGARDTPPASTPSTTPSNTNVPTTSPKMPNNMPNNMPRMPGPVPGGPPGGPGPGGHNMGYNMPMSDVRMRANQSRYRMGNPNVRQPMPGGLPPGMPGGMPPGSQAMTVPPGQHSPMGGNMAMMPNQGMRPQVRSQVRSNCSTTAFGLQFEWKSQFSPLYRCPLQVSVICNSR